MHATASLVSGFTGATQLQAAGGCDLASLENLLL